MFAGYLDDPAKTAEAIDAKGFLHSGDIGEFDDDGYLRIVDRKKELIITAGGKNISPANLEAKLKLVPLIGQAAVIGDARPFVSALVVLEPDAAAAFANREGIVYSSVADLAGEQKVIDAIGAGIAEVMREFNNAEQREEMDCSRRRVAARLRRAHPDVQAQAAHHRGQVRRRDPGDVRPLKPGGAPVDRPSR